jgi:DNA polymerase-3 subunit beta
MASGVVFSMSAKELKLTAINPELGEARETMPVEFEGESLEIGFNPRYFIEAATALSSDVVQITFQQAGNPCVLTGQDDPGFIGVIMPVKI